MVAWSSVVHYCRLLVYVSLAIIASATGTVGVDWRTSFNVIDLALKEMKFDFPFYY